MRLALGTALLSLLIACAPAFERPQFAAGEGALLEGFRRDFAPVFDGLAVEITGGVAYRYAGEDALALAAATDAFYLAHPGFCPVADGFFYLTEQQRYVTFAARDRQVAVFGYDLSKLPALSVVHLEGVAVAALPILPCRTAK